MKTYNVPKPNFEIGDVVCIVGTYENDWRGERLLIAQIGYDAQAEIIQYATLPIDDPKSEGLTDGWTEDDLKLIQKGNFHD